MGNFSEQVWGVLRERRQASAELAELLAQEDDHDDALRVLDRAVEQDRFAEHLYRQAIALERKRGRPEGARRRYEGLKRLLAEELGINPTEETEAVYRDATDSLTRGTLAASRYMRTARDGTETLARNDHGTTLAGVSGPRSEQPLHPGGRLHGRR